MNNKNSDNPVFTGVVSISFYIFDTTLAFYQTKELTKIYI